MVESEIIKPPIPCPVCGAAPECRIWSNFVDSGYLMNGYARIMSTKHSIRGSQAIPLICTVCGYVQLFVNPEDFQTSRHLSHIVN